MDVEELKKNLRNRGLAPAEAEGDRPSEHADVGEFEKPLQTRPCISILHEMVLAVGCFDRSRSL